MRFPIHWISYFDALPWWGGIAYRDEQQRRLLVTPVGVNLVVSVCAAAAFLLRHPALVGWLAKLETVPRATTFEGKLYRAQLEIGYLRVQRDSLQRRVDAAEHALKDALHTNLAIRSEPCNLRRNDA